MNTCVRPEHPQSCNERSTNRKYKNADHERLNSHLYMIQCGVRHHKKATRKDIW